MGLDSDGEKALSPKVHVSSNDLVTDNETQPVDPSSSVSSLRNLGK